MANKDIITNINYLNKDFRTIYSELLDTVKLLTNDWDPSLSNESDPGVVLIKLLAIIGDKNNYNIDKNILEAFPSTVTQYGNAYEIFNLVGYHMRWYNSADVAVNVKFKNSTLADEYRSATLPVYTMLTNSSSNVVYTIIPQSNLRLPENDSLTVTYTAREGKVREYAVGGNTAIKLNNLDDNLRLYLEDTSVAENGIFINNVGDAEYWTKVDNLASYPLNNKVYSFGVLPNSNTCYIQFPQDIVNLIQDGLNIHYLISSGESGNIKALVLDRTLEDVNIISQSSTTSSSEKLLTELVYISNQSSSSNGKNPETISEAYANYEKTKGTFNTLITTRDFENAVYNLYDGIKYLVSNCIVSDRTNDLSTCYVQRLKNGEEIREYDSSKLNAFELRFRLLNYQDSPNNSFSYNDTFKPNNSLLSSVEDSMEESGLSHCAYEYSTPTSGSSSGDEIFMYKIMYAITCKLITSYKVSQVEGNEIVANVRESLFRKYNARQLEFGKELNYSDISDTILNSDSRIKDIILYEPEQHIVPVIADGTETNADNIKSDAIAKAVLNGNLQGIVFNEDFTRDFGMGNINIYKRVKSITSEVTINFGTEYTLKENENIQVIYPRVDPVAEYVYCKYSLSNSSDKEWVVEVGKEITIPEGCSLSVEFTDANNTTQDINLTRSAKVKFSGFNSNINISSGSTSSGTLVTGQSIVEYKTITDTVDSSKLCYWITNTINNDKYVLFSRDESTRILDNGEWFFYTDKNLSGLVIMGSGTKVSRAATSSSVEIGRTASYKDISENGVKATVEWYTPSSDAPITLQEMYIDTYGQGNTVEKKSGGGLTLTNSLQSLGSDYKIVIGENTYTGDTYYIRSRLNINMGPDRPQVLGSNQTLDVIYGDNSSVNVPASTSVCTNYNLNLTGGTNIDTKIYDASTPAEGDYKLAMMSYTMGAVLDRSTPLTKTTSLNLYLNAGEKILLPVYVTYDGTGGEKIRVTSSTGNISVSLYNEEGSGVELNGDSYTKFILIENSGSNAINASITFDFTNGSGCKSYIGYPHIIKDDTLITGNTSSITGYKFNYTYKVPAEDLIEKSDFISSDGKLLPEGFWNINHPYNRYTIAQIDVDQLDIQIAKTSLLRGD